MKHRIFTYFGVHIPPWKKEKLDRGGLTVFFVLTGKVPSKKNNQQAVAVRRFARKWAADEQKTGRQPTWGDVNQAIGMVWAKMRGNTEYLKFLEKMKPVLQHQCAFWSKRLFEKGLVFPLPKSTMTLKLYFKDRYVTDTVNKQQTIQDLLQHCGIIANDDYKTVNPIHSESASYYEEIIHDIAFISLFFTLKPQQ